MPSPLNAIVSSDPPKAMGWLAALKALLPFGSEGENIELPNESGMVDPRLPPDPERQRKAFAESNRAALQGLRGAGQ